jgi:fused signal recognition particle receptor
MNFSLSSQQLIFIAAIALLALIALILKRGPKRRGKGSDAPLFAPDRNFAAKLKNLATGADKKLAEVIPAVEEILITADVGIKATERLVKKAFSGGRADSVSAATDLLKDEIATALTPVSEFAIDAAKTPFVIYLVGVNGVGKTTTIGKLARQFSDEGRKVMLVAADTFRAAAVDQLKVWAERNGVAFVGGAHEADPASVIVDGLRSAKAKGVDVVLVDTAGRLHTKSNLMQELSKMVRMSVKEIGRNPDEIFLVVDAVTGQNGFNQAKIFLEAVPVSGIVLTKYDATAKGGIIISIVEETGIPIRYVGLGEKVGDLKKFDAKEFVERLFAA